MVVEARKLGIKFVWLYVAAAYIVAISAAFPVFLIAREVPQQASPTSQTFALSDTILLAVVAVLTAGLDYLDRHGLRGSQADTPDQPSTALRAAASLTCP